MSNVKIHQFNSVDEAADGAADRLQDFFAEVARDSRPTLLLLSSSSSLKALDSGKINEEVLRQAAPFVTVGVLDERFSYDVKVNNFQQISQTKLFKILKESGCGIIDTSARKVDTQGQLAFRFDSALKMWRGQNLNGQVIITQGIGIDGHTAGIMPTDSARFAKYFEDPNRWTIEFDAKHLNHNYPDENSSLRITVTMPFLRHVDHSIVYLCGEGKRDAYENIFKTEELPPLYEVPGAVVHEMKDVEVFTDLE